MGKGDGKVREEKMSLLPARKKILVITNISVLGFYGYIENIGKISMDILTKISVKRKLTKIL